jgi:hypothetical protein
VKDRHVHGAPVSEVKGSGTYHLGPNHACASLATDKAKGEIRYARKRGQDQRIFDPDISDSQWLHSVTF